MPTAGDGKWKLRSPWIKGGLAQMQLPTQFANDFYGTVPAAMYKQWFFGDNVNLANTGGAISEYVISESPISGPTSLGNPVATWTAHGSLAAVGASLFKGVATWSMHGVFAAVGAELDKQVATWAMHGTLAAVGVTARRVPATWSAHGSLAAVGALLNKQTATFAAHGVLAATGTAARRGVGTWSAQGSLSFGGSFYLTWQPHLPVPLPRRGADPVLKQTCQSVATLKEIRQNDPVLRQTRKTQPLLGD